MFLRPPKWSRAVTWGDRLRIVRSDDTWLCVETEIKETLLRR
jgi:hypothetical protein